MAAMNAQIEQLFAGFTVNGVQIPVCFLRYEGHGEPYITYMHFDNDRSFSADDQLAGYVTYYDFDIYSKSNYLAIVDAVIDLLQGSGWTYQVSRSSQDMYEDDTGYFHKTLCFAIEREV